MRAQTPSAQPAKSYALSAINAENKEGGASLKMGNCDCHCFQIPRATRRHGVRSPTTVKSPFDVVVAHVWNRFFADIANVLVFLFLHDDTEHLDAAAWPEFGGLLLGLFDTGGCVALAIRSAFTASFLATLWFCPPFGFLECVGKEAGFWWNAEKGSPHTGPGRVGETVSAPFFFPIFLRRTAVVFSPFGACGVPPPSPSGCG